uniref:K Homology domain-containing protein n=1 Tax=Parastrongyloides trichosuri TaxID=131310 RepID=A0A0N4ZP28_PARTI
MESGGINKSDNNNQISIKDNGQNVPQMSVLLTVRLLMQGKEVGSIIGRGGDQIRSIREKSQAKINISDGSCPERIVTITGNEVTINKAFTMICDKFEEDLKQMPDSVSKPPITLRLIVPATQCGSVIGKQGTKIREIRERTGASIQVASEMLPSSTERAVTISGSAKAITLCMAEVCKILLEAPPRGTNIPYRPKSSINPVLVAQNAAVVAAQQSGGYTALLQQQAQNLFQQAYNPLLGIPNLSLAQLGHQINPAEQPATSTNQSQGTIDPSYYLSQASLTGNPLMWQNVPGILAAPTTQSTVQSVVNYGENKDGVDYYQNYLMANSYVGRSGIDGNGLKRKGSPNGTNQQSSTTTTSGYANGSSNKKKYSPY